MFCVVLLFMILGGLFSMQTYVSDGLQVQLALGSLKKVPIGAFTLPPCI